MLRLKAAVPLQVRLVGLYGFTIVGAIIGEIEIERVGIWSGFQPLRILYLVAFATPHLVILSFIKMSTRMLLAIGIYCLSVIGILSAGVAHSESSTASLVYLYLWFACVPISIVSYFLWSIFTKQEKDDLGKVIDTFYTKTSIPVLTIIALCISTLPIIYEVFLVGLVYTRWKISPERRDKVRLLLYAAALWIIPRIIPGFLFWYT